MNILYSVYLFCSAVILLFLAGVAWRRRSLPAGREFALFSASVALLVALYALELTQGKLEVLKLIVRLEWCFGPFITTFWLFFGLVWCGFGHLANRPLRAVLLAFSTMEALLYQFNDYHGLIYTAIWVDTSGPFPILREQNGPWSWVDFTYMNACILIVAILFFRQFRNARPLHRQQALIMLLASLIPAIFHIGFSLGIGNGIYITAFGLSISALLFAWGMFRHHLLDMAPVARHELVEMMRDPVLVFDEAGRLVDHNRAACSLLHDVDDHETEISRMELAHRSPELAQALERAERGEKYTFHNDTQLYALSLTALRPSAGTTLTLCLLHDITEQSRAEENLRVLNATLEERIADEVALNRAKDQALARQSRIAAMGEMVTAIAHQWRQPLAILSMIVQDFYAAAHQEGAPSPAEWDAFKTDSLEQIQHMSQTIEEFRNFQRPDQNRERFPVARCLEEALRLCGAHFREHHIVQDLRLPPGDSSRSFGVPSQLTQVLLNLLINAKEAIEDARARNSGQPEQGRVIVTLTDWGERLLITVADNGCCVPEEQRDRIFEPYVTTKEEQGGTGLGLYLARMLVETGFGGTIIHAALPDGACFVSNLPIAPKVQP
jgi:signal transduction histidine kinase